MLIMYRSILIYAPRKGPAGNEQQVTLWWRPAGLKVGIWSFRLGGGKTQMGRRDLVIAELNQLIHLEDSEMTRLYEEMMTIDSQEGLALTPPPSRETVKAALTNILGSLPRCMVCNKEVTGPAWGLVMCAECANTPPVVNNDPFSPKAGSRGHPATKE